MFTLFALLLSLILWLYGVQIASNAPHHYRKSIGDAVIADTWTTNNIEVLSSGAVAYRPDGSWFITNTFTTNVLWRKWTFFK